MEKLLKLSKQTIPTFLEMYNASYPRHAVTYTAFKSFLIQSETFPEINDNIELLTLNDEWHKDGLFIMKNGPTYYFDSLEAQPFNRVKNLLHKIDYSKPVVFRAVRDQFKPMMDELLWLKNLEIIDQTGTTVYFLTKEFVLSLPQLPIPEGWYFRSLTLNDVGEINQKLLREGGDNIRYVENSIKYKLSVGLFDESGKLQGWLFGIDFGTQGTLGVTDEHQQKGFGSAIAVKFANMLINEYDCDIIWHTAHGNNKAHGVVAKFKPKQIDTVTWMAINKRVSKKMTQMGMYQILYPKL